MDLNGCTFLVLFSLVFLVFGVTCQTTDDCCLNELCPYYCVRCDGTAQCFDLSDELGCSAEGDKRLNSYDKPPIFVPFVLNTLKSQIRKEKESVASLNPQRQCLPRPKTTPKPRQTYSVNEKVNEESQPAWAVLLRKLGGQPTTVRPTTTEAPVWLQLLQKLQAEQNQPTTTTTTTMAVPTTEEPDWFLLLKGLIEQVKGNTSTTDTSPVTPPSTLALQAEITEPYTSTVLFTQPTTTQTPTTPTIAVVTQPTITESVAYPTTAQIIDERSTQLQTNDMAAQEQAITTNVILDAPSPLIVNITSTKSPNTTRVSVNHTSIKPDAQENVTTEVTTSMKVDANITVQVSTNVFMDKQELNHTTDAAEGITESVGISNLTVNNTAITTTRNQITSTIPSNTEPVRSSDLFISQSNSTEKERIDVTTTSIATKNITQTTPSIDVSTSAVESNSSKTSNRYSVTTTVQTVENVKRTSTLVPKTTESVTGIPINLNEISTLDLFNINNIVADSYPIPSSNHTNDTSTTPNDVSTEQLSGKGHENVTSRSNRTITTTTNIPETVEERFTTTYTIAHDGNTTEMSTPIKATENVTGFPIRLDEISTIQALNVYNKSTGTNPYPNTTNEIRLTSEVLNVTKDSRNNATTKPSENASSYEELYASVERIITELQSSKVNGSRLSEVIETVNDTIIVNSTTPDKTTMVGFNSTEVEIVTSNMSNSKPVTDHTMIENDTVVSTERAGVNVSIPLSTMNVLITSSSPLGTSSDSPASLTSDNLNNYKVAANPSSTPRNMITTESEVEILLREVRKTLNETKSRISNIADQLHGLDKSSVHTDNSNLNYFNETEPVKGSFFKYGLLTEFEKKAEVRNFTVNDTIGIRPILQESRDVNTVTESITQPSTVLQTGPPVSTGQSWLYQTTTFPFDNFWDTITTQPTLDSVFNPMPSNTIWSSLFGTWNLGTIGISTTPKPQNFFPNTFSVTAQIKTQKNQAPPKTTPGPVTFLQTKPPMAADVQLPVIKTKNLPKPIMTNYPFVKSRVALPTEPYIVLKPDTTTPAPSSTTKTIQQSNAVYSAGLSQEFSLMKKIVPATVELDKVVKADTTTTAVAPTTVLIPLTDTFSQENIPQSSVKEVTAFPRVETTNIGMTVATSPKSNTSSSFTTTNLENNPTSVTAESKPYQSKVVPSVINNEPAAPTEILVVKPINILPTPTVAQQSIVSNSITVLKNRRDSLSKASQDPDKKRQNWWDREFRPTTWFPFETQYPTKTPIPWHEMNKPLSSGVEEVPTTTTANDMGCMILQDASAFCKDLNSGQYKNPTDCTTYFVCDWGDLYRCSCPPNTLFDGKLRVCNWDYAVTC